MKKDTTYDEMLRAKILSSSLYFTRYFFKQRFRKKFVVNHHHETICNALDRVLSGKCKRLLIRMPPRYGKTELAVKGLIAHGLALNPSSKFIHLSFSSGLAEDNSEEVRDFVQEEEYQRLFPYVEIDKSSSAKKKWYTTSKGGVYATATGGQITGFGAGAVEKENTPIKYYKNGEEIEGDLTEREEQERRGLIRADDRDEAKKVEEFLVENQGNGEFHGAIIIDDPVKPDDADSETKRERVNDRFENTIRSRTNSRNTPIIVIGQAVHERDLIGYLMETEPDDWELLTLPAIGQDEDGEDVALWPFKHTLDELYKMRRQNEYVFGTQYQQDPSPKEGLVFFRDELNYFNIDDLRTKEADGVVIVGDIADEGDDSLSVPVGYLFGEKIYITDVVFTPEPVEITQPIVAAFIDKHAPDKCRFESNNGGKAYALKINEMISHRMPVTWKPTTKNKHTRILMKSGIVKENFYFRDDNKTSQEYIKFMRELTSYTKNGKVKHDDAPDAITMMAELTENNNTWGW